MNSGTLGSRSSTLSLGQPGYNWNGLHIQGTGIYFQPGPTIQADSSNVIVSSNLIPDVSNNHSLGSAALPWANLYVSPTGIQIGPTGSISADPSGDVVINIVNGLSLTGPQGPSTVYDSVYNQPPAGGVDISGDSPFLIASWNNDLTEDSSNTYICPQQGLYLLTALCTTTNFGGYNFPSSGSNSSILSIIPLQLGNEFPFNQFQFFLNTLPPINGVNQTITGLIKSSQAGYLLLPQGVPITAKLVYGSAGSPINLGTDGRLELNIQRVTLVQA